MASYPLRLKHQFINRNTQEDQLAMILNHRLAGTMLAAVTNRQSGLLWHARWLKSGTHIIHCSDFDSRISPPCLIIKQSRSDIRTHGTLYVRGIPKSSCLHYTQV